jgi:hypothetical protein
MTDRDPEWQRLRREAKAEFLRWREAGEPPVARGARPPGHIAHDVAERFLWSRFHRARLKLISPPAERGD